MQSSSTLAEVTCPWRVALPTGLGRCRRRWAHIDESEETGLANIQMGADAPGSPCDHVALARGSFGALDRQRSMMRTKDFS
jgi:hypothetical protein